ncbi:hypothetical protein [Amycolatopsis methanolica]|uniref:Uncharacterized protein n=1 Tax=Amycolatopsis methanolica 239 TaxID=1068978 RepID=A0A076MV49_AMYME|nr:hypothetical protein [Amycolatopsis methanolica]AIJ22866.1 hypothetical protein AMETH_2774 [Amycolatopsis methanolica 239]
MAVRDALTLARSGRSPHLAELLPDRSVLPARDVAEVARGGGREVAWVAGRFAWRGQLVRARWRISARAGRVPG